MLSLICLLAACTEGGSTGTTGSVPTGAATASAFLEWDANQEPDVAGYKIYKGAASGQYGPSPVILPSTATGYEAPGLQKGETYFFVVAAFDTSGNESPLSDEVTVVIP